MKTTAETARLARAAAYARAAYLRAARADLREYAATAARLAYVAVNPTLTEDERSEARVGLTYAAEAVRDALDALEAS